MFRCAIWMILLPPLLVCRLLSSSRMLMPCHLSLGICIRQAWNKATALKIYYGLPSPPSQIKHVIFGDWTYVHLLIFLVPFDTSMGCCSPRTSSPRRMNGHKEDILFRIPGALIHLLENKEVIELARGDFVILRITEGDTLLATVVKIGPHLQWPLTKDEPVVKLDQLHYLFTLPDEGGRFLNYGVSFAAYDNRLASLEVFLKENACFSTASVTLSPAAQSYEAYWKGCAPSVEEYNGVLAKAIAGGTGEIVKGIFRCSSIYSDQVHKGAALVGSKSRVSAGDTNANRNNDASKNCGEINKSLRRVRKLSEMTENMSKSLLNGVIAFTGIASIPLVRSKAGKALLASVPGEVVMASLDAINKVLDAVEMAERKTLAATSDVVSGAVSKSFGESAGEATEDVFATAGHAIGTAWNIFKIRKALKPSSGPSSMLKSAVKNKL